ncbi:PTS sugar transporter subunit IIA [Enterococcus pallens]|uniref:PTS system, mannose/fructose/sorbose family, IIA component n=1 Tax=Enterococcus pallens ATCC BAA-351 TaxID=1158607 RepID=R2T5N8_9ENTE|nr:PTS system, mannose/fructose/sorbose family, IIA component [Enterococcus pallens]EOH95559.1 PTS system, mannose/fructose/sorbose family, IIA component [Enterococcus pallens ATCC BAA-351]EOU21304.1 hypothetical protein I588_02151 [Enterococcus pallens ATCC BAA-351]OJG78807.1 PTS system, mannose/fructose/sorbose family, IIA component [Enterococcus pallens]
MEFKKEPAILIATHGPLCQGLIDSSKMIMGEINDIEVLPLLEGMNVEKYEKEMADIVKKYEGDIVICLDIIGGTPYNTVMKVSRDWELCAVAGVNFPMVFRAMELRMSGERNADVYADQMAEAAAEGIKNMNADLRMLHTMSQG